MASQPECIVSLDRVSIRPYTLADAPASAKMANDPDIAKGMRNTFPHPYELHHAEFFITKRANETHLIQLEGEDGDTTTAEKPQSVLLHYALIRSADGAYIGGIGLKPGKDVEARMMEIGYWLGRDHRGQGYASEAVAGFSDWTFATFPQLQRLEAMVFEGNTASERVLVKAGYQKEGVRRKAIWKNGKSLDLAMFGKLRSEQSSGLPGP